MMILRNQILSTNNLVLVFRRNTDSRCGRFEPQSFLESGIEVFEFLEVFEFDWGRTADIIDFVLDRLIGSRGLDEEMKQE
jgi:hypothetical protein